MSRKIIIGECDCCAGKNRLLHLGVAFGIDTAACADCSSGDREADADEIADEIERLRPMAETGEQWAHLCALDNERIRLLTNP